MAKRKSTRKKTKSRPKAKKGGAKARSRAKKATSKAKKGGAKARSRAKKATSRAKKGGAKARAKKATSKAKKGGAKARSRAKKATARAKKGARTVRGRARKRVQALRGKAKTRIAKARTRARKTATTVRGRAKKRAATVRKRATKAAKKRAPGARKAVKKGRKTVRKATRKAAKKAVTRGRKAARKAAKKAVTRGRKAAKKAMKKVQEVVLPLMTDRKTIKVRDPKSRAHEKGPGFHTQVWYRPPGVEETGLQFVGHEIADDDVRFNQFLHYDQLYTIRHGQNSMFFRNLLRGKIIGTRCKKCGDGWVPPRTNCWNLDCDLAETEWEEFPLKAKVHTWTIAGWSGRSSLKRLPIVLVYAIFEGSTVAIANELHEIDPWDVEFGMPLKVRFIPEEDRIGAVTDFVFVPAKGWKPGPMTPEKERIKKMVEPVYAWVKSMK